MTEFREERFVADYPVPVVDVPTDRHAVVQGPVGRREKPTRPEVAAAGGHTGAMIALVPSAEHVDRLAVDGGEPAEELHLTVMYLGEVADISEDTRAAIYSVAAAYAASTAVIEGDGFAVNAFNPHTEDRETALVMGVGGRPLADLHAGVSGRVRKLMTPPENHAPWVPHITFKYSDDLGEIPGLVDKLGPVTFDRLRVAMGDEVTDYPLSGGGNDFDVQGWAAGNAGKLRLGQPGGFRRCVKRLRDEPGVTDPEGLCATMHHRATGKWPGEGHIVTAGAGWREELHSRDGDGKFSEKTGGGSGSVRAPRRSMDIEDLILKSTGRDENGDLEYESYELDEDTVADASEMLAISHGGLSTANFKFEPSFEEHTPGTWIQGDIVDSSGANVGNFVRRVYQEDGRLKVEHTNLKLDAELQGQGFAQAFNKQLFDWYRSSGVREVRLTANIDVGGYAWARAGYDWADGVAAENIRTELSRTAAAGDERIPSDRLGEQRRLAAEMEDRFSGPRGDNYPTPYEVSQLGRWPGAGKDDWWIGKAAMMGSEWEAVIQP